MCHMIWIKRKYSPQLSYYGEYKIYWLDVFAINFSNPNLLMFMSLHSTSSTSSITPICALLSCPNNNSCFDNLNFSDKHYWNINYSWIFPLVWSEAIRFHGISSSKNTHVVLTLLQNFRLLRFLSSINIRYYFTWSFHLIWKILNSK